MSFPDNTGNPLHDLFYGILGTVTPLLGFISSLQEQGEYWIRVTSLVLGIAVAIFSLIKLHKSTK